jgi:hypothetical protein
VKDEHWAQLLTGSLANPRDLGLITAPIVIRDETEWKAERFQKAQMFPEMSVMHGKPLLAFEGRVLCEELIVRHLLHRAGWEGVWVDNFTRRLGEPTYWTDVNQPGAITAEQMPFWNAVAPLVGNRRATDGCWDIFAWKGSRRLFVEIKGMREPFKDGQDAWPQRVLAVDTAASFLVVQYRRAEVTTELP